MIKIILGFLSGILFSLAALFFIWPQYSDYRSRTETDEWLISLTANDKKSELIKSILTGDDKARIFADLKPKPDYIQIVDSNALVMKGGRDGQVIVLVPQKEGEIYCVVGPTKASPKKCN